MKLLLFISQLSCGGAERVAANMSNYWVSKGWSIILVTLTAKSDDFYELSPKVRRVAFNLAGESKNLFIAIWNNIRRIRALRRVLLETKPDIALSMMDKNNVLLALASVGLKNVYFIGSEHIHPPQYPLGRIWELLRRWTYRWLDAVVALTSESGEWLRRHTSARLVRVIPNAVPSLLPSAPPYALPPNRTTTEDYRLLAIGRLVRQKGFDILISAFKKLSQHFPAWRLYIVGEGPLRGELMRQIVESKLQDRVILVGRVGNVGDWYRAADIYVMSSRFEGFPNTLVEAMAHGLPVVSFACETGPASIIRDGYDGMLVPPGDVEGLVRALGALMTNHELRRYFGERALEVHKRFSVERIADMWESLFDELQQDCPKYQ
ncbi:MAG: glycosyltransferase family 4 protein [Gammaproteobacteria bacterium]|nr:glycosyltransferase family 4 protein [Gammaproteobacteria bacterium]